MYSTYHHQGGHIEKGRPHRKRAATQGRPYKIVRSGAFFILPSPY